MEENIQTLYKSDNFWSIEASPSNNVEDRKIRPRKGGVALSFHPRQQFLILDKGLWLATKSNGFDSKD